ncbi:TonB-dependent receptor [Sediminibacterium roseum]|uniref:TonB-dependent receptor n=1 Tax=Sediminibacterium roseum TaxID=1978412 RepID=A0ABW9ZWP6_9BACT|nr:TonB-dependent receptor [Sediminibacterium roseum]NCI50955.1 TonB-dependent receptor [Sediminibacterium roseum]
MNPARPFFFILLLLFPCTWLAAQQGAVQGVIVERQGRAPIEFASVSLVKKADSAAVAGTLSQKNGLFSIPNVEAGDYLLKVISLGYQTMFVAGVHVSSNKKTVVDSIALMPSEKLLGDVTVSGTRSTVANKIDRQTFKASQFESAKGSSAVDVIRNLPSVTVDAQGEISMRGSTGFLVLINGKPVLTDAQTILSQLPANTIESVELLTAPSAKYDADGKAGIINITTKKGATDGVNLLVNLQSGLPSTTTYQNLEHPIRFGGDATLNFRKNKWDISISANYTRNDANGRRDGDVYTKNTANNTITRFPSNGERSFDRYNYGGRMAIGFSADKNNVFNLGFFAGEKYQQRRADLVYRNSVANLATGSLIRELVYFNSNLQTKQGRFLLGSADYTHGFKNGSALTATGIYEYADLFGNTRNINLDYPAKSNVFQEVYNPYVNPIKGYRLKIDYSIPVRNGKIESGYQYRNDSQDGRFDYYVTPPSTQPDLAKFSGTARSVNRINSLYSQYAAKSGKFQYVAGLRYEYAVREVILSSATQPHELNMGNLMPSVNLLYTINTAWSWKAGYSKRIQRNNNFELNPIPEREHSETLEQGDPDLLPQVTNLVELGITHTFKGGSFFSTLYYQDNRHPIQRVNSVYADTILNRLFTNAERAQLLGLEAGLTCKPFKWMSAYLGANIYNYKVSGALNVLGTLSEVNNTNWVYSLNMNLGFELGKNWNLQANTNFISRRPTAQGEDSRFLSPNTALKKTLMKGRLSIGLQWQNMNMGFLNANQQRITTFGKDFYTTTNYIYETDVFLLNFGFAINKLNSKSKLPVSEIGEKEF